MLAYKEEKKKKKKNYKPNAKEADGEVDDFWCKLSTCKNQKAPCKGMRQYPGLPSSREGVGGAKARHETAREQKKRFSYQIYYYTCTGEMHGSVEGV